MNGGGTPPLMKRSTGRVVCSLLQCGAAVEHAGMWGDGSGIAARFGHTMQRRSDLQYQKAQSLRQ